jgi:methyl-accepting chemotaxis protein
VPAKTHGERIDRLEQVVQILAEGQISLEKAIAELATETRRGFDQVSEQFKIIGAHMQETDRHMQETDRRMQETDRRMRETDERMRQTDERMRRTDERIDKLVIAIGEFISRNN